MSSREKELINLQSYIGKVDTEVTIILQQLQWNTSYLLQKPSMIACKYNANHRIPIDCRDAHEKQCLLWSNGYSKEDILLPDPMDPNTDTLIKLSKNDIKLIIDKAAKADPSFKKGSESIEPLTLARLQATYTADERRVIHDAVVNAAPSCHDLSDLTLLSNKGEEQKNAKQKSRLEILSELRDMKRRCTKYRGAAPRRGYSDILRDVIKTQMEVYTEVKEEQAGRNQQDTQNKLHVKQTNNDHHASGDMSEKSRDRYGDQDKLKRKPRRDSRSYGRSSHSGDTDRYTKQGERFDKYSHRQKSSKYYSDEFDATKYEGNHKRRRKHRTEKGPDKDNETKRKPRHQDIGESSYIVKKEKYFESNTDIHTDIHIRNDGDKSYSLKRNGKRDKSTLKANTYAHSSRTTRKHSDETCIKQKDDSYETCSSSYKSYNETKYNNYKYKYRHEKDKSRERIMTNKDIKKEKN